MKSAPLLHWYCQNFSLRKIYIKNCIWLCSACLSLVLKCVWWLEAGLTKTSKCHFLTNPHWEQTESREKLKTGINNLTKIYQNTRILCDTVYPKLNYLEEALLAAVTWINPPLYYLINLSHPSGELWPNLYNIPLYWGLICLFTARLRSSPRISIRAQTLPLRPFPFFSTILS